MFLSVQKIYGKGIKYGNYKGVVTYEESVGTTAGTATYYRWKYTDERFERKNLSYKFVVKHSYRVGDKVKQKQLVLGTYFWYDFIYSRLQIDINRFSDQLADLFDICTEDFERLEHDINIQIDKIESSVAQEYHKSEEFRVYQSYFRRVQKWESKKLLFEMDFGTGYFEQIYDFDLRIQNKALYEAVEIMRTEAKKKKQEDNERTKNEYEQYKQQYQNLLGNFQSPKYSDDEKGFLKKFYKKLAMEFHPDIAKDDGKAMQFLNKLKEEWQV